MVMKIPTAASLLPYTKSMPGFPTQLQAYLGVLAMLRLTENRCGQVKCWIAVVACGKGQMTHAECCRRTVSQERRQSIVHLAPTSLHDLSNIWSVHRSLRPPVTMHVECTRSCTTLRAVLPHPMSKHIRDISAAVCFSPFLIILPHDLVMPYLRQGAATVIIENA